MASHLNLRFLRLETWPVLLLLALLGSAQTPPQPPATGTSRGVVENLPTYEGQNVTSIELAGWPGLQPEPLLAHLPQAPNQPFARAAVEQSIAELKTRLAATPAPNGGRLQDIALQIVPEPGGIRILFVLQPAEYLGVFQFPGALRFSYTRLLEAFGYEPQQPYSDRNLAAGQQRLEDFFHQQGYFQARVNPVLHPYPERGLVDVTFAVHMGPRARFGEVTLAGATPQQMAYLQPSLRSWLARLRRSAILPGHAYSLPTLENATQRLQSALNGHGHLGAQVVLAGAKYDVASNRADITFNLVPGPKVQLAVEGMHLWPWNHGLIPIYQESRVDAELIQEGQENLVNYLSSRGYFNASVTTTVQRPGEAPVVTTQSASSLAPAVLPPPRTGPPPAQETITYTIHKGPQHDVESIGFQGNRFFSNSELQALVQVKPEGFLWFSHGTYNAPLLASSVQNIEALYQASGYSGVSVTPRITYPNGNLAIEFVVKEGAQDFVDSLRLEGNTLNPEQIAPQGFMVGPGTPFAQKLISQDRARILAQYYSLGYLNATLHPIARQAPGQPHLIDVTYRILEGPQVRTAAISTLGLRVTQQRLVDRHIANIHPEGFLTENDMLTAESQLYAPGIFDWAEVRPRDPITTQTKEDVVVKVHEAQRNSLVYGFGFDFTNRGGSIPSGTVAVPGLPIVGLPNSFKTSQATFWGPSGNLQYTRTNIAGKAETLSAGVFAGRLDQRGSFTFTDPSLMWSQFSGNLLLSAEHDSQNPIFTARTGQIGYQLERPLNSDRTTNLFLRYSYSQISLTRLLIPDLVPERDRSVRLSTVSASYLRDTRDNPLDAHKGMLESYEVDFNPSFLGSSVDFGKVVTQTAYYKHLPANIIWANSLRVGLEHAFGSSFVPLSQTFFTGGGSTLRGFPLDGAGPQKTIPACGNPADPATCSKIQVPVGGDALFLVNSELRIPTPRLLPNLGLALFYDGGNVFSHVGFTNLGASYTNTVGIGLRYNTAVGPIRIDLGHNLNGLPGINATQLFITLGQAF